MTKLPLGSREREDTKHGIGQEIIDLADKWEKARELVVIDPSTANSFYNRTEKLARMVRKYRRL